MGEGGGGGRGRERSMGMEDGRPHAHWNAGMLRNIPRG